MGWTWIGMVVLSATGFVTGCDRNNTTGLLGGLGAPDLAARSAFTAPNRNTDLLAGMDAMNGARILMIIHTADAGEIASGKLAETRASSPRVRAYANMLVTDHTEADREVAALAQKDSIALEECPTSEVLERGANMALDHLRTMNGADFDRAYVDAQVDAHHRVLTLIDDQLMKRAASLDVRTLLEAVRTKIVEHYDAGMHLQTELKN